MKNLIFIFLFFLGSACAAEDDADTLFIEPIFIDNPSNKLLIDIIYVLPTSKHHKSMYQMNESQYLDFLNGCFFHRNNIGFELGESKTLISSELYDLKDNRGNESIIFSTETYDSYKNDRLNIYIIPRENTIAIAGIGLTQRALITDEFLFKSTSPHEIGHALGLSHLEIEGNIMSQIRPYLRKDFDHYQVDRMIETINSLD